MYVGMDQYGTWHEVCMYVLHPWIHAITWVLGMYVVYILLGTYYLVGI